MTAGSVIALELFRLDGDVLVDEIVLEQLDQLLMVLRFYLLPALQRAVDIRVDAHETAFLRILVFDIADKMRVDIRIADDGVQPRVLKQLDILRLLRLVGNVVHRPWAARPFPASSSLTSSPRKSFRGLYSPPEVLEDDDVLYLVVKIVVFQAAELDKRGDVLPAFVVALPLVVEQRRQLVRHLFGDMCLEIFCTCLIVLQEASRNVERNVGAVDHAVEKHQETRE